MGKSKDISSAISAHEKIIDLLQRYGEALEAEKFEFEVVLVGVMGGTTVIGLYNRVTQQPIIIDRISVVKSKMRRRGLFNKTYYRKEVKSYFYEENS